MGGGFPVSCQISPLWFAHLKTHSKAGNHHPAEVVLYSVVGIVGGMAYPPFYDTNENLFSKLNAGGSKVGQATVAAYPMLQNVTSIPVLAILIRCNLIQGGLSSSIATFIAVGLPWLVSIPFYTGSGFDTIAEVGGLATSSIINFMIPLIMQLGKTGMGVQGRKQWFAGSFIWQPERHEKHGCCSPHLLCRRYVVAVGRKKEREELLSHSKSAAPDACNELQGIVSSFEVHSCTCMRN